MGAIVTANEATRRLNSRRAMHFGQSASAQARFSSFIRPQPSSTSRSTKLSSQAVSRVVVLRLSLVSYLLLLIMAAYGLRVVENAVMAQRMSDEDPSGNSTADGRDLDEALFERKIRRVPLLANRFEYPWYLPPHVEHKTLEESQGRILYSSLRTEAGEGLGHAFAMMNAEVGAALRLGLTYTHRVSNHGRLTRTQQAAIEELFGWGAGEIPREYVHDRICRETEEHLATGSYGGKDSCAMCESVRLNATLGGMQIEQLVDIPDSLTYSRGLCGLSRSRECRANVKHFLSQAGRPGTVFQIGGSRCDENPTDAFIERATRGWFFHKYWLAHGSRRHHMQYVRPTSTGAKPERLPHLPYVRVNAVPRLHTGKLQVAIEATSGGARLHAQARAVREVLRMVQARGGVFARVPVSVTVYSNLIGAKGQRVGARVVRRAIMNGGEVGKGAGDGNRERLFRTGLEVAVRDFATGERAGREISAIREMIAADVFVGAGGLNGVGRHVVSSLARGIHLLPEPLGEYGTECCHVVYDRRSGEVANGARLARIWKAYATANGGSLAVAGWIAVPIPFFSPL